MFARIVLAIVPALWLAAAVVHADTLPLPQGLIDLRSTQGEELLRHGDALDAYVPLSASFVTQKTQSYCGVASMVTVLNALGVPGPASPEYAPYRTFTQDNILDARTEAILPRAVLLQQGMTLDELWQLLALYPVEAEVHHAADSSLEAFRKSASQHLGEEGRAVIVNFLREGLGQQRGGHHSPLAAYDPETDRFLILDVARYKYPPVWVSASRLFDAMNTPDHANEDRTRGYVLIRAAGSGATKLN
jgi:hypothetical protein